MPPLRRHQLAQLSAAGWSEVLHRPWDADAHACLSHWAQRRWPLVVTRQAATGEDGAVALGLPAPLAFRRRRLALRVPPAAIAWFDEFPRADEVLALLPFRSRAALLSLLKQLAERGARPRAYGSFGWQRLTGESYLHPQSDLDLWIAVDDAQHADAVVELLQHAPSRPRIDGELQFADGSAVAWREWAAWRAGRTRAVLIKRLHGASLAHGPELALPCAA